MPDRRLPNNPANDRAAERDAERLKLTRRLDKRIEHDAISVIRIELDRLEDRFDLPSPIGWAVMRGIPVAPEKIRESWARVKPDDAVHDYLEGRKRIRERLEKELEAVNEWLDLYETWTALYGERLRSIATVVNLQASGANAPAKEPAAAGRLGE